MTIIDHVMNKLYIKILYCLLYSLSHNTLLHMKYPSPLLFISYTCAAVPLVVVMGTIHICH